MDEEYEVYVLVQNCLLTRLKNMLNLFQAQQVLPAEKAKEIKHQKKEKVTAFIVLQLKSVKSIRSGSRFQTQLLDNYTAIRQQISESNEQVPSFYFRSPLNNEQLRKAKALRKTSDTEYDVFQNRFKNRTVSSARHSDSGYILINHRPQLSVFLTSHRSL